MIHGFRRRPVVIHGRVTRMLIENVKSLHFVILHFIRDSFDLKHVNHKYSIVYSVRKLCLERVLVRTSSAFYVDVKLAIV